MECGVWSYCDCRSVFVEEDNIFSVLRNHFWWIYTHGGTDTPYHIINQANKEFPHILWGQCIIWKENLSCWPHIRSRQYSHQYLCRCGVFVLTKRTLSCHYTDICYKWANLKIAQKQEPLRLANARHLPWRGGRKRFKSLPFRGGGKNQPLKWLIFDGRVCAVWRKH